MPTYLKYKGWIFRDLLFYIQHRHTDAWNCIKECTAEPDSTVFGPYKNKYCRAEGNNNFGCVYLACPNRHEKHSSAGTRMRPDKPEYTPDKYIYARTRQPEKKDHLGFS